MARTLQLRDRELLNAGMARPTRRVDPTGPRWTHPLARFVALALGFDPDSGEDVDIRATTKKETR